MTVGRFNYENTVKAEFDDRLLAHLQQVICNKLRRGEPFLLTWREDLSTGEGRTSVWVHPHAALSFTYFGSRRPSINRQWLEALAYSANQPRGCTPSPSRGTSTKKDTVDGSQPLSGSGESHRRPCRRRRLVRRPPGRRTQAWSAVAGSPRVRTPRSSLPDR